MNYLNLEISILTSEEFLGSEPVDRATWLCLMRYCAQQENGGVIEDCNEWGERKWQQICGVTKTEVDRKCKLWTFDNGVLTVWEYPVSQEQKCRDNRKNGKKGGRVTKELLASKEPHALPDAPPCAIPTAPKNEDVKERKERESKESVIPPISPVGGIADKVEEQKEPVKKFIPPTLEQVKEYAKAHFPELDCEQFISFYQAKGWMIGKNKMKDWEACVRTWKRMSNERGNGKLAIGQTYKEEGTPAWNNL